MKKIVDNFFTMQFTERFDGIITDPPYKGCIVNQLSEENFNVLDFMQKSDEITIDDSFLVVFCNFAMSYDLREFAKQTKWKFHCYQIWDKSPTRTWISWSIPLRTCEFVLYFKKGNYKFSFKSGKTKSKVNRTSFGGLLKNTKPNTNEISESMYEEIVKYKNPKNKIHPTQKPIEFSIQFKQMFKDVKVLDPFCGSGQLIAKFERSIGIDIKNW